MQVSLSVLGSTAHYSHANVQHTKLCTIGCAYEITGILTHRDAGAQGFPPRMANPPGLEPHGL
jgi:hypothetical protein